MPVYEYTCRQCGGLFEKLLPVHARDQLPACPACGSRSVSKLFSTFAAFSASGTDGGAQALGGGCACATGGRCGCAS
jgi:putative FmdB family regulatory protein